MALADIADEYIDIEGIIPQTLKKRAYQINIYTNILKKNSLVIVPTGLGKTIIALMLIAKKVHDGKIIFLAPTKPLCEQHFDLLNTYTTFDDIYLLTGEKTKKAERKLIYKKAKIIVATPQTIANDIENIDLKQYSLIVFDEVHRTVGNYAYVPIAHESKQHNIQMLGLTASPGSNISRLKSVINHLDVEIIESRTEEDSDVKPYIPKRKLHWKILPMPQELKNIAIKLNVLKGEFLIKLNKFYRLPTSPHIVTKKMLIDAQNRLQSRLKSGNKTMYNAISIVSSLIKIYHLYEMLTSQGVDAARAYLKKIDLDSSRAAKRIRINDDFIEIKNQIQTLDLPNQKLVYTKSLIKNHLKSHKNARIIIFAEYRDTITSLFSEITKLNEAHPAKFIGQSKIGGTGMSQEEQKETIQKFRKGDFNILISTSIGEEGIDIPTTSLVIFYEPVPSAIRHIQRRGRTARGGLPGEVHILIMKDSRDEAYYWNSRRKEKKMNEQIAKLKSIFKEKSVSTSPNEKTSTTKSTATQKINEKQSKIDSWY